MLLTRRIDGPPALRSWRRLLSGLWVACATLALPAAADASFLSPELEDKVATGIAIFVLFVVPVVLIVLFWMVHVLPEKIAHKRHHPQFEAIRTLCLLSLAFGGLLWPIAWMWAYTKPVGYKMAYGTDKPRTTSTSRAARGTRREGTRPGAAARPAASGWPLRSKGAVCRRLSSPRSRADLAALEAKLPRARDARWKSCCSASTASSSG